MSEAVVSPEQLTQLVEHLRTAALPGIGALSTYVDRMLDVADITGRLATVSDLKKDYNKSCLMIGALNGSSNAEWYSIVVPSASISAVLEALLGEAGDPARERLSDMERTILEESLGQLAEALNTNITQTLGGNASFSEPVLEVLASGIKSSDFGSRLAEETLAVINLRLVASDGFVLEPAIVLPLELARNIINSQTGETSMPDNTFDDLGAFDDMPAAGSSDDAPAIQPVEFPYLDTGEATIATGEPSNIDLIKDVSLDVTVQLGRTSLPIKDVLDLANGSIVTLDKAAGSSVDLLVNNKLYARGEVVVIDENFGVRITDILSPEERITDLDE